MVTIQSTLSAMPSTNSNKATGMEYSHRQDRVPIAHSPSQLDNLNWKKLEKDQEYRKKTFFKKWFSKPCKIYDELGGDKFRNPPPINKRFLFS